LRIPAQLRLLSRLLNVSIHRMLQEFIDYISMDIYGCKNLERRAAFCYFVQTGYGCQYFTVDYFRQMLHELDEIRHQWPGYEQKLYDAHELDLFEVHRRHYLWDWYRRWREVKRTRIARTPKRGTLKKSKT
jgi:hypothetical protein